MPMTSARPSSSAIDGSDDLVDAVEVVLADVDQRHHRLVGEQEVGLAAASRWSASSVAAVDRRARREQRVRRVQRGDLVDQRLVLLGRLAPLLDLALDRLEVGQRQLDLERPGGTRADRRAGHVGVDERPQQEHDRVDLADVGEELVAEALAGARALRPGRRCRRTARWPARPSCELDISASRSRRSSGTLATPTLGSVVANAYGAASAPPPASAL